MASSQPSVAVAIVCYNKADYVGQAIRSVADQPYRNVQIMVVDDGSTDNSLEVINAHAQGDDRIRVFPLPHTGDRAVSRNKALTETQADYILFLDGDDYIYPDYIETAVRHMESHPEIDMLHSPWDDVDQDGNFLAKVELGVPTDYLRTLLLGNIFAVHAMFSRGAFLRDTVGPMKFYIMTDDWEYWIRCAKQGCRFGYLDRSFVATRKYLGNNKRVRERQHLRFFPIINDVFAENYGLPPAYRAMEPLVRVRHHILLMQDFMNWGWADDAQAQFEQALALIARHPMEWQEYIYIAYHLRFPQVMALSLAAARSGDFAQIRAAWSRWLRGCNAVRAVGLPLRRLANILRRGG